MQNRALRKTSMRLTDGGVSSIRIEKQLRNVINLRTIRGSKISNTVNDSAWLQSMQQKKLFLVISTLGCAEFSRLFIKQKMRI